MRSLLLLAIVVTTTSLGGVARAAGPSVTVVQSDAGVRIGREPNWRAAAPGMAIAAVDLIEVPQGAKITLKTPDGSTVTLEGRTVISGRRLLSDKTGAGRVVFFNKAFQDASATLVVEVEETGSTSLAARGTFVGDEDAAKLGKRKRAVTFLSDDENAAPPRSTHADFAEWYVRRGDWQLAADAAWLAIVSADSHPLDRRRGHLVLARLAANEGKHELSLRDLNAACRAAGVESGGKPYVAAALVSRGQAWMALGDDARAMDDFRAALDFDPKGAAGAQANFFLGALALSQQDVDTARNLFSRLNGFPELAQAGAELLAAVQ